MTTTMPNVTLAALNAGASPDSFGGLLLGADTHANELWQFGNLVANYNYSATEGHQWSADVAGWGYADDDVVPGE